MKSCLKTTEPSRTTKKRVRFELPIENNKKLLPCLSSKDDSPLLWELLILENWERYYKKNEEQLRDFVNNTEFRKNFWYKVDKHILERNDKLREFGHIFTEKQLNILRITAEKYKRTDKKEDLIEYFIRDPLVKQYFSNQIEAMYLINTGSYISKMYRRSKMVIKLKFIDACYKAVNGELVNNEIEKKEFYKRLIVSANKHRYDMLNGIKHIMFTGQIHPEGRYNPENGCYFYAIYEEIVKQAIVRLRHIDIIDRLLLKSC